MSKNVGDIGELAFSLRAKQKGFEVLKPYSSISVYDLLIENKRKFLKIQVKTVNSLATDHNGNRKEGVYKVGLSKGTKNRKTYTKKDVDFFAVYIMPLDLFYIIPHRIIKSKAPNFYPNKKSHKFSKYLENWELLK